MSDALYRGRRFRTLNILDEGVREALEIVVDTSIPSGRVVRTMEQLRVFRGLPKAMRLGQWSGAPCPGVRRLVP